VPAAAAAVLFPVCGDTHVRLLTCLPALAATLLSLPAAAQTLCDPDLDTATCPPGSVDKYCPVVLDGSCTSGKAQIFLESSVAPPPEFTEIVCQFDPANFRYFCDAWPKRGELSYAWDVQGDAHLVGSPYGDQTEVRCTPNSGNLLHVTVTSPFGLSTSTSLPINCSYLIDP
jgi:hypothetical protein